MHSKERWTLKKMDSLPVQHKATLRFVLITYITQLQLLPEHAIIDENETGHTMSHVTRKPKHRRNKTSPVKSFSYLIQNLASKSNKRPFSIAYNPLFCDYCFFYNSSARETPRQQNAQKSFIAESWKSSKQNDIVSIV